MLTARRPHIVVAGQIPPPYGGQNVMIAHILSEFARTAEFECTHLPFNFTTDFRTVRKGSLAKVLELGKVIFRLLSLRLRESIDLLIFPTGGPQTVPIIRDILLLPWALILARRVVLQFHAAGIADRFIGKHDLLVALAAALYRRCFAAIVMTESNRRDPKSLGVQRIEVIPHRLPDQFDPALRCKDPKLIRMLYVGHLCPDKGTPELLRAFKTVADRHREVVLELVGECLPPLSEERLREEVRHLGLAGRVAFSGVLTGRSKLEAFGRADLFVFPSIAPYESFGLVMVEAMMWGLPVVATDWRGNREVLGRNFEGICHPVGDDLAASIAAALAVAVETIRGKTAWFGRNRQIFLDRFSIDEEKPQYPELARRWLTPV